MVCPRGVAQLVEQRSPKPQVVGSSPAAPASDKARGDYDGDRTDTDRGRDHRPPEPARDPERVHLELHMAVYPDNPGFVDVVSAAIDKEVVVRVDARG
jgi:hypothetical protein